MGAFTKRNHSNPCFWTALWNAEYFEARRAGRAPEPARSQQVFALTVQANKVYPKIVAAIRMFFERTAPIVAHSVISAGIRF